MRKDERKYSDSESPPSGDYGDPGGFEKETLIGNGANGVEVATNQKAESTGEQITKSFTASIRALQALNAPIVLAITSYAVCSSCMLVVNKVSTSSKP